MNKHRILYEDKDILVCHKPAGIATQTARVGQADMVSEVANYLVNAKKEPDGKGLKDVSIKRSDTGAGIPYVGVVHRLDQPVEGILVFAKNKQAAAILSRQAAGEEMKKEYLALVCGKDIRREGELTDYLLKDGKANLSRVVPPEVKGAKKARLSYEVLWEKSSEALLSAEKDGSRFPRKDRKEVVLEMSVLLMKICLYTGRHHQIRVQMANAGMPLLGDHKYADEKALVLSKNLGVRETALCAYRLSFTHPKTGKRMRFEIRPEDAAFRNISIEI